VGAGWPENAYYQDITKLLNGTLSDEQMTWLYHDIQQATGYTIRYYGVEGYDEQIFNIFAFLADKSNILTALRTAGKTFHNPEDDFIQVKYTGYSVNTDGTRGENGTWTAKELNDMTESDRSHTAITGTSTVYKAEYFNTMFYRTYIGYPPQQDQNGEYQTPRQQIPCYTLKHFMPAYVSPFPYYGYGRSAVVIAKYYEGAFLNGTVTCNNTPLPYVSAVILDQYGFPHDNLATDANGTYHLLAPGGNITVLFSYANEVLLKQITLNNTNSALFAPFTDAEAMRLNGSKFARLMNVSVNLSTLEGFVYQDNNHNGSYEPATDTPLPGITVELNDYYFGRFVRPTITDAQGHYVFHDLYPSKYNISAIDEHGFTLLDKEGISVVPDRNWKNVSKPQLAAVKGVTYYNTNSDSKYNPGEEISGVHVQLNYTKLDGTIMIVDNATTDASGAYSFTSLFPGLYTINATKVNTTTGYLDYSTKQTVTLTANKTSWVNISLTYAPAVVSGYTTLNTKVIENIPVIFAPDKSVRNNTVTKQVSATSDITGLYVASLTPGFYNVSVKKTEGSTTVYSFAGKLVLTIGEGVASYPIALTKESITVHGNVTYNGIRKANLTINFRNDTTVAGNNAKNQAAKVKSDGTYTVEIAPGSYVINVSETVNESGQMVTYTYSQMLTVSFGEPPQTVDILLTREQ
jgi:hypothetical protein